MNNKNYEYLLKSLLETKGIEYKTQKTSNTVKFEYENNKYSLIFPDLLIINNEQMYLKNPLEIIKKINQNIYFEAFDKLLKNINFWDKFTNEIKLQEVQIKILNPLRQSTIWYESCFSGFDGALLSFDFYNRHYTFALEKKNIEIKINEEAKQKIKKLSTSNFDNEKLKRYNIFVDKDVEIINDAKVLVYANDKIVDTIKTNEILKYLKNNFL